MQGKITLQPLLGINTNTHTDDYLVPKKTTEKTPYILEETPKRTKK